MAAIEFLEPLDILDFLEVLELLDVLVLLEILVFLAYLVLAISQAPLKFTRIDNDRFRTRYI